MPEAPADVLDAIERAWDEGCPVAGQDLEQRTEIARIAVRRWGSADRRHPRRLTREVRVEDLAKGLCNALEQDPSLAGPLMKEYRFLAARVADALNERD